MPSLCLVAGDPSGDAHAAALVQALRRLRPDLSFVGLGGSCMRQAGVELLDDLTQTAAIGPFDAARHLGKFVRARRRLAEALRARRPTAAVLIDFGDFNLPVIAPLLKRFQIPVSYYISPQLWAWGRFRLRWVRRYVDRMIVLFQFEEAFYRRAGVPVTWVGHPLVEQAHSSASREQILGELGLNPWRMTVGLLPGSRAGEVARHLPLFIAAAQRISWHMPGVQFLLPKAPHLSATLFRALQAQTGIDVTVCEHRLYDCLQAMDGAIVTSGTATLETALFEVPMVVVYRTSWPTYVAAKLVVRLPHIALVNVIAGGVVVPELIQHRATPAGIAKALVEVLRNPERHLAMRTTLRAVKDRLGPPGAVERAAQAVLEMLKNSP
ncbi:MAG: lipid-A-disaccharide synthase [Candidatus Omnitrophica bacterium]|nr:lipid-A-disaccharide synthase [Candidatus Omnitrophota bacterium]